MKSDILDELDNDVLDEKPAMDVFSEFDELDEIEVDVFNNTISNNYQDLINEAKAKKGIKEENVGIEDDLTDETLEMNTTKNIDNLKDEVLEKLKEIKNEETINDEPIEEVIEEPIIDEDEQKRLAENKKALEMSFIYCSIIGFLVLFICYGVYLYFITH